MPGALGGCHLAAALPVLLLLLLGLPARAELVGAGDDLRRELLGLARDRVSAYSSDKSHYEGPKERDGVKFWLSREDKACGGDGVPVEVFEFDIQGARPVDAFNVIADSLGQPSWDSTCSSMSPLGDFEPAQARAFAGLFTAHPFPAREVYEWQVADANFSTEEFWLVFSTLDNDELKQRKPPEHGAVQMQTCLAAYSMTRAAANVTHVIATVQSNTHPWPLDVRTIIDNSWGDVIDFANAWQRNTRQKAAERGWNATRTTVPPWMLEDKPCGAPAPRTGLRDRLLVRASKELRRADRGREQPPQPLPGGGGGALLRTWESDEECSADGVPSASVPRWQGEFPIPPATPTEVFNVLAAKGREARWNNVLRRANTSGFQGGARGLHESFALPEGFARRLFEPRELWEWQAADHNETSGAYTIAYASMAEPNTGPFSAGVRAAQCLAAYEISPLEGGGSLVRMSSHMNPNLGAISFLLRLWRSAGRRVLYEFAANLTSEAVRLAGQRGQGVLPAVDGDALQLLEPQPPGTSPAVTVPEVLGSRGRDQLLQAFVGLDLPRALNASAWLPGSFAAGSGDVLRLFDQLSLRGAATEAEAEAFSAGPANDSIQLQAQGAALTAMQWRVLANETIVNCSGGHLPDINGDESAKGLSLLVIIGLAVLLLAASAALLLVGCCACKRRRRRRGQREAAAALVSGEQHPV